MEEDEVRYKLKGSLEYSHAGEGTIKAEFITLTGPTAKHSRECSMLKQAVARGIEVPDDYDPAEVEEARERIRERREDQGEDPEDEGFSGYEVMMVLARSRSTELADVMDVARTLLTNKHASVAMVDGVERLTVPLFEQLSLFASHALCDGGGLLCLSGQSYLPQVLNALQAHLAYWWCCCYHVPGPSVYLRHRNANTCWKPLVEHYICTCG